MEITLEWNVSTSDHKARSTTCFSEQKDKIEEKGNLETGNTMQSSNIQISYLLKQFVKYNFYIQLDKNIKIFTINTKKAIYGVKKTFESWLYIISW